MHTLGAYEQKCNFLVDHKYILRVFSRLGVASSNLLVSFSALQLWIGFGVVGGCVCVCAWVGRDSEEWVGKNCS